VTVPVVVTVMPMIVLAVGVAMVVPVVVPATGAVHMGCRGGGDGHAQRLATGRGGRMVVAAARAVDMPVPVLVLVCGVVVFMPVVFVGLAMRMTVAMAAP
jgi:hypothetical protein